MCCTVVVKRRLRVQPPKPIVCIVAPTNQPKYESSPIVRPFGIIVTPPGGGIVVDVTTTSLLCQCMGSIGLIVCIGYHDDDTILGGAIHQSKLKQETNLILPN
jgi:hypothetical protein